jgi:ABC-type dipeptide/oligopeptide/nickel transport system permease subunit
MQSVNPAVWSKLVVRALPRPTLDPLTSLAIVALLGLTFIAFMGERIAPFEPIYFVVEHGSDPRPYDPGLVFPFGSDVLGRDLFSIVLAGARATLTIVLLAGAARVIAGAAIAALGSWWRPLRLLTETFADFVAAIPATLVALLLIKAFVKTDTSIPVVIAALLVTGWAGPYRVIRAEMDRVVRAPFTEGALVIGIKHWRLFWRHQLPHLMPTVAVNFSQQVVASLVLVAELGVLGVLVSTVRSINIEESQTAIRIGPPMSALVPDVPEWGAMLASSRTVEILWATRWVIFVPGAGFALTAIAVGLIGFGLARRYARRDLWMDMRGATGVALAVAALFAVSSVVPERYAEAREWASAGRAALAPASDLTRAFADAGLREYEVAREVSTIARNGPATVAIGDASVAEIFPRPIDPAVNTIQVQSVVRSGTGGGLVEAPLVFAARGIVPSERPAVTQFYLRRNRSQLPTDLGDQIKDYPDDYAGIDVRGKVVLLVRFLGVTQPNFNYAYGPQPEDPILSALDRGAAAVLFVDPELNSYNDSGPSGGLVRRAGNPYLAMEQREPPVTASGKPVVILDRRAAETLVAPLGVDLDPLLGFDPPGKVWERSAARDLGVIARVNVPLRVDTATFTSVVAEVPGVVPDAGRVVVWAERDNHGERITARTDVLAALARLGTERHVPFTFVDFDPRADADAVREVLRGQRILLVLVLEHLDQDKLRFDTANGDLIPAFDLYSQKAGARYEVTRQTATAGQIAAPLPDQKTVVIRGTGGPGDGRADAVALIAYLAGRLALGAPELGR